MVDDRIKNLITAGILLIVWGAIAGTAVTMVRDSRNRPGAPGAVQRIAGVTPTDTMISRALHSVTAPNPSPYGGSFENPFRTVKQVADVAAGSSSTASASQSSRKKLQLKGVLTKDNPLAIMEDETGQTYIKGVGETIGDLKIVKITVVKVTLRDRFGTYDISVKE
jgi:hypothetical protein